MKTFSSWLKEKTKESIPTTAVSAPLRGNNQDYTGVGVKHDTADYTISDEKTPPDSWEGNSENKRIATVKKLIKQDQRYGALEMPHSKIKEENTCTCEGLGCQCSTQINEIISGQPMSGPVQPKVSQASGMPRTKTALQKVTDARVKAKEKADQKQDEFRAKTRQKQIDQRKQAEDKRKAAMEEYIEEGRPKKNKTEEDPGSEHVIMQLRKVITTRGQHKVKHVSGETSHVDPAHAHKMLAHHDNLKTSAEKQSYAARLHKSASSMKDAIAGKPEHKQPKVSLAGKITGTQK
jgi:hypothetical protein